MKNSEKAKNILILIQQRKDHFYQKYLDDKFSLEKRLNMAIQWDKDNEETFGPIGNPYKDDETTERMRRYEKNSYEEYTKWEEIYNFTLEVFLEMMNKDD